MSTARFMDKNIAIWPQFHLDWFFKSSIESKILQK